MKKLNLRPAKNKFYSTAVHMLTIKKVAKLTGDEEFSEKIEELAENVLVSIAKLLDELPWELEMPFNISEHPEFLLVGSEEEAAAKLLADEGSQFVDGGNTIQ